MKTVIVYDSKYGSTQDIAQEIKGLASEEIDLINLGQKGTVDLTKYECIIIGSPIYAGSVKKSVKMFCEKNMMQLLEKKLVLFTVSTSDNKAAVKQLKDAYPEKLVESAFDLRVYKGNVNFNKMKFFDKLIMKTISKKAPQILEDGSKNNKISIIELLEKIYK